MSPSGPTAAGAPVIFINGWRPVESGPTESGSTLSRNSYRYEVTAILISWITLVAAGVMLSLVFRASGRDGPSR